MRIALQEHAPGVHLFALNTAKDGLLFLQKSGPYIGGPTPDLVLVDYSLPDMTGGEMLRTLQESDELSRIPALIFTSMPEHEVRRECCWLGRNCVVSKPSRLEELYGLIRELLRLSARADVLLRGD